MVFELSTTDGSVNTSGSGGSGETVDTDGGEGEGGGVGTFSWALFRDFDWITVVVDRILLLFATKHCQQAVHLILEPISQAPTVQSWPQLSQLTT